MTATPPVHPLPRSLYQHYHESVMFQANFFSKKFEIHLRKTPFSPPPPTLKTPKTDKTHYGATERGEERYAE